MSAYGMCRADTIRAFMGAPAVRGDPGGLPKQAQLRALAIQAYHAATTPTEAKMAGILCDLFVPDMRGQF